MTVETSIEGARGCGYRKPGASGVGIYLMGGQYFAPCGRLPYPLHVCPVCGEGIKPARGWTWIEPINLFVANDENGWPKTLPCHAQHCESCWFGGKLPDRAGLLWIGEAFYRNPHAFMREAAMMGVSRKVSAIPRDFVLGETVVYLAHRRAIADTEANLLPSPGVFTAFVPTRVDLVVDSEDETKIPDKGHRLRDRLEEQVGLDAVRFVRVIRDVDAQGDLFGGRDDDDET